MVVAAFVAPYLLEATQRFLLAAARIPEVRLGVVTHEPAEALPPELRAALAGHWRVDDALDPRQVADAVRGLRDQMGPVERVVGALEQLQVPLAQVREELGLEGMDVATALNVRDKARMKEVLRAAGRAVRAAPAGPRRRPTPAGSPTRSASRSSPSRRRARGRSRPTGSTTGPRSTAGSPRSRRTPGDPALLEEWLSGHEHTLDSVTQGGSTVWSSISDYRPPPLEVLRTPWIQWTVLLPREIDTPEYAGIAEVGPAALRALGVRDALTHMEWFRRPDGSIAVSEVAARPPGAQISSMIAYSHDIDFHARLGRAGAARPVRPAGAAVRQRHGLPARAGARPGARGARARAGAARARAPRRRGPAAAARAGGRDRATRARAT